MINSHRPRRGLVEKFRIKYMQVAQNGRKRGGKSKEQTEAGLNIRRFSNKAATAETYAVTSACIAETAASRCASVSSTVREYISRPDPSPDSIAVFK
jgi:hypothetical protein